jgi:hypothetical protein
MHYTGGPAFPTDSYDLECGAVGRAEGMTLRDYFAAKAMQALCVETLKASQLNMQLLASNAYAVADAMLQARDE